MMTQKYTLSFIVPANDGTLMSFDCDTLSNSPIYDRDRVLYAAGLISSLNYSKQLYAPNTIDITLHVVDANDENSSNKLTAAGLQTIFEQATVELTVTYTEGDTNKSTVIATNYFVYQVTPIQRSTSSDDDTNSYIEVKLLVYSMDKLFDIAKGCRSYVGLRLGHDIMKKGEDFYKASATLAPKVNYADMAFLGMSTGLEEALQPFLVQYNETFYTMLARTANRCGEFLYFEDGQLNLGVGVKTDNALSISTGNKAGSVLLSSIEYPSKTVNPFEAITYRYQRNPQNKVDLKDDSKLEFSMPNYNDLPPKDSIQKMEEALAAVKVPLTVELAKENEEQQYVDFANSLEIGLNDLIDRWIKENNGKEPQQAYKDLAEIKQMIAKINASKTNVENLKTQKEDAENKLPAAEQEVVQALGERENAQDPELWHKKDIIYQQKLAKKQQYEKTIDQCTESIENEENTQQKLTEKLKNEYGIEDIDNFDEKAYIDKVKNYWINVEKFIKEELKKCSYYILKDKYRDEEGKLDIDINEDDSQETQFEKKFIGTTIYQKTIKKIDDLLGLIPAKKAAQNPTTKENRIVQDLIQGADDYFGVGPALHDHYVSVMECMSSKSTFSGMTYYLDKCAKEDKPAYNHMAYFLGLFNKFFNTTKPWVTFMLEQIANDAVAIAYAAETMKFTNDSYNSHFYKDEDKELIKAEIGLDDTFQPYALKEDSEDSYKSKRLLYSVVSYPKHTFDNFKYKKPNSDGALEEATEYEVLKSYFYKLICKLQELVSEERIVLNVRTADNQTVVKLGDTISHDNHKYIVIEDKASFDTERDSSQFTQRIVAVPVIESKPIPPMCPQGHFGKAGSQPGFVVDNLDPSGQGRVRVRFAWQKEEKDDLYMKPTPYIRVATPYATSMGGGIFFRPRVGDEVMISFEHDNPERPYVSSSLFNSEHKPFLCTSSAPNSTVIASHNGHSINLYDENNSQFLNPIVNSPFISQAITSMAMGADSLKDTEDGDFAGSITLTDFLGMYKISASTTERNITISSPMGDVKINAMTGITIEAPYGDIKIAGKNITLEARNKITMTSGLAAKEASKKVAFMDALKTGLQDTAAGMIKKIMPIDIGLVRCIMERFLEPIDGTTLIKSHNYLKLEAGTGVTTFENQQNNSKVNYDQDISDDNLKKMAEPQLIGYLATEISKQMSGVLSEKTLNLESIREVAEQAINQYETFVDKITSDNKLKKIIREGADAKADQYIDWAANHYVDTLKDAILDEKFYSFIYKDSDAQFPKDEKTESVRTGILSWDKRTYFVNNIDCQAAAKRLRLLFASMCEKVCAYKSQLEKFKESLNADNVNTLMTSKVQKVINAQVQPCSCLAPDKKVVSNVSGSVATLSGNIYDKYIGTEGCKAKIQLQPTADLATLRKKLPRIVVRSILLASDALVYDDSVAGSLLQKISPSTTVAIPSGQLAAAADAVSSILSNPTLAKDLSEDDVIDDAKWTAWVSGWSIEAVEKKKSFKDKVLGDLTDLADAISDDLPYFGGGKGYKAINARQPGTILMSGTNGFMLSERDGRFKLVRINESIEALQEVLLKL